MDSLGVNLLYAVGCFKNVSLKSLQFVHYCIGISEFCICLLVMIQPSVCKVLIQRKFAQYIGENRLHWKLPGLLSIFNVCVFCLWSSAVELQDGVLGSEGLCMAARQEVMQ